MRHTTPANEQFFKSLEVVLDLYSANKNLTRNIYFSQVLGFKTEGAFSQHLTPHSNIEKNLTAREVLYMMDICKDFVKPVLDELCKKYGYVCSVPAVTDQNNNNFEELFLKSANINGKLATTYLKAIEDGKISKDEAKQLNDLMYQFRALIRGYEFDSEKDEQ